MNILLILAGSCCYRKTQLQCSVQEKNTRLLLYIKVKCLQGIMLQYAHVMVRTDNRIVLSNFKLEPRTG